MSETDNDTSAIDDKKNEDTSSDDISIEEYVKNGLSFLVYIVIFILLILSYFMNGSFILFLGKLAQSNILPTDKDCSPYTSQFAKFGDDANNPVEMNIYSTIDKTIMDKDKTVSKKISFENDKYNSSNTLIDAMKKYKNASSSNFLFNYFISIMEGLLQTDYSLLNSYMNLTNKYISEKLIMSVGPVLFIILFVCLFINDFLHFVYLWFSKMSWFFKTNTNDTGSGTPKWENVTLMSPFSWFIGVCFVCIFFILFFVVLFIGSPLILGRVLYVIVSCLFYKAILYNADGNNESVNGFSLVLETFKQYKLAIIWIITVMIIVLAFFHIGIIPGSLCVAVVFLLYCKIIPTDIFDPIKLIQYTKYNDSDKESKQNTKTCQPIRETTSKTENSFLYNLFIGYLLNLFGLTKAKQQGGKNFHEKNKNKNMNINKSLKKIYKLSKAK